MRLIDGDELYNFEKTLYTDVIRESKEANFLLEHILYDIQAFPTVDAVPVVRCKDCKHREKCNTMSDDSFCSDGERMADLPAD